MISKVGLGLRRLLIPYHIDSKASNMVLALLQIVVAVYVCFVVDPNVIGMPWNKSSSGLALFELSPLLLGRNARLPCSHQYLSLVFCPVIYPDQNSGQPLSYYRFGHPHCGAPLLCRGPAISLQLQLRFGVQLRFSYCIHCLFGPPTLLRRRTLQPGLPD